ncbi:MAG: DNA-3-methyladenine glycosylase I [Phycisphaerales bacterium]
MSTDVVIPAPRNRHRCFWCGDAPDYVAYHDTEWGVPSTDDRHLFEKIVLEGFQSGLSWLTILRKREAFRAAMADFDASKLARFGERDVARLVANAAIVRHRGKIESAINNARRVLELREEHGSLATFLWRFAPTTPRPALRTRADIVAETTESKALSKELRRRGFSFVGPTTMYAMMQAVGIVNDHFEACFRHAPCARARRPLAR